MDLQVGEIDGLTKLALAGRMDTAGTMTIELPFTAHIVPKARSAIVDISGVTFIASMGIRLLLSVSRALSQKQARLVLFGVNEAVEEVIETAGLAEILAITRSEADALALAKA